MTVKIQKTITILIFNIMKKIPQKANFPRIVTEKINKKHSASVA